MTDAKSLTDVRHQFEKLAPPAPSAPERWMYDLLAQAVRIATSKVGAAADLLPVRTDTAAQLHARIDVIAQQRDAEVRLKAKWRGRAEGLAAAARAYLAACEAAGEDDEYDEPTQAALRLTRDALIEMEVPL